MGANQSSQDASAPPQRALHIVRVAPGSPAAFTDLEPFFDFLVGIDDSSQSGQSELDAGALERIVAGHEGRSLGLRVWSSKTRSSRVVPISPSRAWSEQDTDAEGEPALLGLSMRMCEPELSLDNVWHVLDVLEGSPAESAGLVPYGDWIIGWTEGNLTSESDFYQLVEAHIDKPLRVYVYSYDFDTIREVVLVPNRQWGGEGLLGCVFGFGLLHRIPPPPTDDHRISEEDEDALDEAQLFVPALAADISPKGSFESNSVNNYVQERDARTPRLPDTLDTPLSGRATSARGPSPYLNGGFPPRSPAISPPPGAMSLGIGRPLSSSGFSARIGSVGLGGHGSASLHHQSNFDVETDTAETATVTGSVTSVE